MNVLITGANGFIGKNLCVALKAIAAGKDKTRNIDSEINVLEYDINTNEKCLSEYCQKADFVFHLAAVNRTENEEDFTKSNVEFTEKLITLLKKHNNTCPIMMSSSTQAVLDNPYGRSKSEGENAIRNYGKETGTRILIYRLPNVFGKWCRPDYNSAVATFCNNIALDLPITVTDKNVKLTLVYIDDVVDEMIRALLGKENLDGDFCKVPIEHVATLGEITDLLYSFKRSREDRTVADMSDEFTKKLYATYLSYIPPDKLAYPLKMNIDDRGSFTEIFRTAERGQFNVNIIKQGITKGNHWHNTKNEKFLVVSGKAVIRFRKVGEEKVYEYFVSGNKLEMVDIPIGYTYNVENIGDCDLIMFMWVSELFDPNKQDAYFETV